MSNKIINLEQEKEEYISANHRQRTRIISLEKDKNELRDQRESLQVNHYYFWFYYLCFSNLAISR